MLVLVVGAVIMMWVHGDTSLQQQVASMSAAYAGVTNMFVDHLAVLGLAAVISPVYCTCICGMLPPCTAIAFHHRTMTLFQVHEQQHNESVQGETGVCSA